MESDMKDRTFPGREAFGDIAPALADYTDRILFGEVWQREGLSPRDRSLVTVAALVALYRGNELPIHLRKALENGVSQEELVELITHLAFYSGWPTAHSALMIFRRIVEEGQTPSDPRHPRSDNPKNSRSDFCDPSDPG